MISILFQLDKILDTNQNLLKENEELKANHRKDKQSIKVLEEQKRKVLTDHGKQKAVSMVSFKVVCCQFKLICL